MNGCTIALSNGLMFTRTFVRDPYRRHLITAASNSVAGVSVHATTYSHDLLSRRANILYMTQSETNALSCAYNARSEVTGVTIDTNDYAYIYDNIGNSLYTSLNSVTNAYTVNALNQYTDISYPVNPVNPVYDLDGNMLTNGVWSFTYDAENRMISAYSNDSLLVSNTYDHQSRRIRKAVSSSSELSFIWDGWNLIHETIAYTNGTSDSIEYVWGLDLSGTLQGAGGVGGLLFEKRNGAIYIPCYDANGNVTAYVDTNGVVMVYRQYDAFGNTIAKGGDMVDVFHFWYSTKYLDHDTGLYYYGYRYYSPMLQRWITRDPVEESGGMNLYTLCANSSINSFDVLGLWTYNFLGSKWSASEIGSIVKGFETLKYRMPKYLSSWRDWASAASKLPDKCTYKKAVQQELNVLYQILTMMQSGLTSNRELKIIKTDYGDDAEASVGMPFGKLFGNTFNGKIKFNSGGASPVGMWSDQAMIENIFHELSHVANVLKESGSEGMWSDYAHNVEWIAKDSSVLVLSPMVNWNKIMFKDGCCPPTKEWMPVKK